MKSWFLEFEMIKFNYAYQILYMKFMAIIQTCISTILKKKNENFVIKGKYASKQNSHFSTMFSTDS